MRIAILCLAALLLAGCAFRLPAAPPPLPTATPTPEPTAAFEAAYADVLAAYNAMAQAMQVDNMVTAFDDPTFRTRIAELAADWRTAANTLRYMDQPQGEKWDRAWPRIVDAMTEFAGIASTIEQAAKQNNPFLLMGGGPRLAAAVALLDEATGILEGE